MSYTARMKYLLLLALCSCTSGPPEAYYRRAIHPEPGNFETASTVGVLLPSDGPVRVDLGLRNAYAADWGPDEDPARGTDLYSVRAGLRYDVPETWLFFSGGLSLDHYRNPSLGVSTLEGSTYGTVGIDAPIGDHMRIGLAVEDSGAVFLTFSLF